MERIAIIGAGGFLGCHLVALLTAQEKAVAGVSLKDLPIGMECADWLACDLKEDTGALAAFLNRFRADSVIHLAATSFEPLAAMQPWKVIQNNLLSTLNTLTACRQLTMRPRCVIVSSSAVYGCHGQESLPLNETRTLNPLTTYGVSKLAVEALTLQHCRAFGLPAVIVRPFNVTGPGEHASFVTSAFARQIARIEAGWQEPIIKVGDLSTMRDFVDVRDVVRALVQVAELGEPGEVYNVCSGVGVRIDSVVANLLKATPAAVEIRPDSSLMRPVEIQNQTGDPMKLRNATGWEPDYTLDQTLADVLEDWRGRIHSEA